MARGFRRDAVERNAKLLILALIVLITYGVYVVHLFTMQGLEAASYQRQSRTISSNISMIAAQRGEIFDRNATLPMVINSDSFAVDLKPAEIPKGHYDAVAARLARFLGITKRDIDRKVPDRLRRSYTPIEIRVNVPFETIADIAENINDLPGVSWRSKPLRSYVETGSIAHVIGYVGDITREELKVMYNKNRYTSNSIVGKTGIEKQYDELLQGEPGREIRTVDVRGRVIDDTPV
ncbi:MAG: penicillin-binding protein 2, partial [Treponemataceae bacterium]|nr:penicillin-binding protein 2 [Treponemataceae bacterium]